MDYVLGGLIMCLIIVALADILIRLDEAYKGRDLLPNDEHDETFGL